MALLQKKMVMVAAMACMFFIINGDHCLAASSDVDLLITKSMNQFEQLKDFTCTLEKKINKKGVLYYDPEIQVKFKRPGHYYFKWGKGEFEGQEVIYVKGKNNNRILGHVGGIFRFITLRLNPEGSIAMKRHHHSLNNSGMQKIFNILNNSYTRHIKTGTGIIELTGEGMIDNRAAWVIRAEFPENMGYYNAKILLYMDKEHMLPIKVTVYDWSDVIYEEYTFHNLKLDVGLNEKDFDPDNYEYNFF
jgi:outer membrane lipoprotein-sorting protein